MKPKVGEEQWLPNYHYSVIIRAHTPAGMYVEQLDSYGKPTNVLFHMRDSAFAKQKKLARKEPDL